MELLESISAFCLGWIMKTPPPSTTPSHPAWQAFTTWASAHAVPDEPEDWEYLWECWQEAWLHGQESLIDESLSRAIHVKITP